MLYLNEGWGQTDGGTLRLCTEGNREDIYQDIEPLAGRLVTFLSGRFFHEVLPAGSARAPEPQGLAQGACADLISLPTGALSGAPMPCDP